MHSCWSKLQTSDASLDKGLRCQEPKSCHFLLQYIFAAWVGQSYCRTRNWNGNLYHFYIAVSLILTIKSKQILSLNLAYDFSWSFFSHRWCNQRSLFLAGCSSCWSCCSSLRCPALPRWTWPMGRSAALEDPPLTSWCSPATGVHRPSPNSIPYSDHLRSGPNSWVRLLMMLTSQT